MVAGVGGVTGARPMTRRSFARVALGAAVGACLLGASGCTRRAVEPVAATPDATQAEPLQETFFAFDTVITLTAYCSSEVMAQAVERCGFFERRFSRTREGSDVWNINHAGGRPVEVAPETAEVIEKALAFCERSGGLFDITIGAVSSLWDFKLGVRPDDAAVQEAVRHVGYQGVHVEGCTVALADPAAMIDLGAIAKGYIADDLARLFAESGCESALINLGGNVFAVGSKPDGSNWRVGIQDPNAAATTAIIAAVPCSQASVVTSGLYERMFVEDGRTFHHILDPRTGYPAETDLVSLSVVSASSAEGDALATWMFLLGRDEALAFLEETPGVEGLVVGEDGVVLMTSGAAFELA